MCRLEPLTAFQTSSLLISTRTKGFGPPYFKNNSNALKIKFILEVPICQHLKTKPWVLFWEFGIYFTNSLDHFFLKFCSTPNVSQNGLFLTWRRHSWVLLGAKGLCVFHLCYSCWFMRMGNADTKRTRNFFTSNICNSSTILNAEHLQLEESFVEERLG